MDKKAANAVSDARQITDSLRRVHSNMTSSVMVADDAVLGLAQDGASLEDSEYVQKYELKEKLNTSKRHIGRVKSAAKKERWGILLALSVFTLVVIYIIAKRTRLLTIALMAINGAILGTNMISPFSFLTGLVHETNAPGMDPIEPHMPLVTPNFQDKAYLDEQQSKVQEDDKLREQIHREQLQNEAEHQQEQLKREQLLHHEQEQREQQQREQQQLQKEVELQEQRQKDSELLQQFHKEAELVVERQKKAELEQQRQKEAELQQQIQKEAELQQQRQKETELQQQRQKEAELQEQGQKEAELQQQQQNDVAVETKGEL